MEDYFSGQAMVITRAIVRNIIYILSKSVPMLSRNSPSFRFRREILECLAHYHKLDSCVFSELLSQCGFFLRTLNCKQNVNHNFVHDLKSNSLEFSHKVNLQFLYPFPRFYFLSYCHSAFLKQFRSLLTKI